jgi:peptidoglycan biosynthesis protein MviN/MurJ (putative lipid II flippase)
MKPLFGFFLRSDLMLSTSISDYADLVLALPAGNVGVAMLTTFFCRPAP